MEPLEVLVVEDAAEYAQLVTEIARGLGHRVRTADSIASAERFLSSAPPDLVILDLTLPDGDGLDLCRSIRERSTAYVVMLTARDDEVDKVVGFRLGADDYVTKPFSPRELRARIEAIARRPRAAATAPTTRQLGSLVIDLAAREVRADGVAVQLTRIEFDLLEALTAHPGQVLNRSQLLTRVWGDDDLRDDHVVDVHVANLRKKLAAATDQVVIRTVRGVGYAAER